MPLLKKRVTIAFVGLSIGFTSFLLINSTQAQVPPAAAFQFKATQACPATQAIKGRNPGNVQLKVGTLYDFEGFNNLQRQFVLLRVPGATPDRRWVSATCGEFQANGSDNPTPTPEPTPSPEVSPTPRPTTPTNSSLLPFFDDENNPVPVKFPKGAEKDITPPAPKLEPFDQKILALCGAGFDAPVDPDKFKQLMTFYPDVVRKLKQASGGALKPNRSSDAAFVQDLETIWFNKGAFKHVFCGEKVGKSIGGLHFVGRYLQLQQEGIAGRLDSGGKNEEVVDGSIYTFGAVIKQGDRVIAQSPVKGYPYTLNAQETLQNGVLAFKQFKPQNITKDACLFTVTDPPAAPYQAVFVEEEGAIRTFYPDATPDSKTKPCNR
ncbi:MAG: EndoU domain-containing protein [Leptolyngbya sp. BL-A-14]